LNLFKNRLNFHKAYTKGLILSREAEPKGREGRRERERERERERLCMEGEILKN
jgi:hypothetical protein